MKSKIIAILFSNFIFATLHAQDLKTRLASAPTEEQIVGFYQKFEESGKAHKQRMDLDGGRYFAYWIVNETGQIQFLWLFEFKEKAWHLVIDHPELGSHFGAKVVWSLGDGQFQVISQKGEILTHYPKKQAPKQPSLLTPDK